MKLLEKSLKKSHRLANLCSRDCNVRPANPTTVICRPLRGRPSILGWFQAEYGSEESELIGFAWARHGVVKG